jgi:tetratricopeptide (TPR) repeat protein
MVADMQHKIVGRRYVLQNELGRGGMGTVYRAVDRLTGQVVALKRVTAPGEQLLTASTGASADMRLSLAQEFRTLSSLRHPNIISVLDYGFDEERQPYFTMELLTESQNILAAGRDKSLANQVELLVQVLQALAYLHHQGIIHRDLKPDNVHVVDERVKVLDFGLASARHMPEQVDERIVGTLAYMAPETLMGGQVSEASDLYAVGLIAYELFAGHHPFNLKDTRSLVNSILTTVPDLSELDVDAALRLALGKLLAKKPEDRYSSAREMIQEYARITHREADYETATIRESYLQAARFVGRTVEIQQLSGALARAIRGSGSAWLIGGESGVGKSRLLDEVRTLALVEGATVLRSQSISEGGSPYHVWRPLLRWLVLVTDLDDDELTVLKALISDLETLLGRVVPDAPELAPQAAQERLLSVIEAVFRRQHEPVVFILEDLHWARESLDVLARLIPIVSSLPVILIGSYRDDERANLPEHLPGMQVLKLQRLSKETIEELSIAILGDAGRQTQVINLLERETEGNVFFLVEVIRVLAESAGQLDQVGLMTLPAHVFAGGVRQIVQQRLTRLPEDARELVRVAAVIGRQLDLRLLQAVDPAVNLEKWLTACAGAAVLDVQDDRWRFAHDKLREGVLGDLSDDVRQSLHRRVAEAIEAVYAEQPDQYATLAYHWSQGKDVVKEAHYTALAGDQSMHVGAFAESKSFYESALRALSQLPATHENHRQLVNLALSLAKVGAYAPDDNMLLMLEKALGASETMQDETLQARVLCSTGAFHYMRGQFGQAIGYFSRGMGLAEKLGLEELLVLPYNILGRAVSLSGDYPRATVMLARGIELAEKFNDQDLLSGSLMIQAATLFLQGRRDEGMLHADRGLRLAEDMGHPSRISGGLVTIGWCRTFGGFFEEATDDLTRGMRVAEESKNLHPVYNAHGCLGYIQLQYGDADRAVHHLNLSLQLADEYKVLMYVPMYQAYLAETELLKGQTQAALQRAETALDLAERLQQQASQAEVLHVLGKIYSRAGNWEKAEQSLQQALGNHQQGNRQTFAAMTLHDLGKLYLERGMTDQARSTLIETRAKFETLDMRWHLQQVLKLQETLQL